MNWGQTFRKITGKEKSAKAKTAAAVEPVLSWNRHHKMNINMITLQRQYALTSNSTS